MCMLWVRQSKQFLDPLPSVLSILYITSGNFLVYNFFTLPPLPPPINFVHGFHMYHSPGPNITPGPYLTWHQSRDIERKCAAIGRSQRWSLLEWGRMNPQGLVSFYERMRREIGFQRFYSSLYDAMRLLYRRMFDMKVTEIEVVNSVLN